MTEHVWSVDVQTSYLAFGFASLDDDSIEVETLSLPAGDAAEGERLSLIDQQLVIYATDAARQFPPACVWVEQPSGRFFKPQLMYVAGVVQACLFEVLGGVPVWTVPPSTWKRNSLGFGNASKEQIAAWVARHDDRPGTQDERDAWAIAYAGRRMFVERRWEVAA